jgi:hypothetical protein
MIYSVAHSWRGLFIHSYFGSIEYSSPFHHKPTSKYKKEDESGMVFLSAIV